MALVKEAREVAKDEAAAVMGLVGMQGPAGDPSRRKPKMTGPARLASHHSTEAYEEDCVQDVLAQD